MAIKINADTSSGLVIDSDTSGEIQYQSAGVTKFTVNSSGISGAGIGGKNLIINGDMRIKQRSGTITLNPLVYSLDRWNSYVSTDGVITAEQSTDAPVGFINSLKTITTTADASLGGGQRAALMYRVEGKDIQRLAWGTSDAKTVTLSFWVKSSITGTHGGTIGNGADNRGYPFTYAISSADTWEKKTITIAGDTTGTWATTNGRSLQVTWGLGVGTTYSATAGTWIAQDINSATGATTSVIGTLNATWYLTGVQLEEGSFATDFEYLPYGTQLALCQRYYTKFLATNAYSTFGIGHAATNARMTTQFHFPTTMRAAPSTSYSGTLSVLYGTTRTNITSAPDSQLNLDGGYVNYDVSGTPFTAITYSGLIGANNDTSCYVDFLAEL